jgi:hypothetical protein
MTVISYEEGDGDGDELSEDAGGSTIRNVKAQAWEVVMLLWILAVVIWVAIAFWPARVADRKGHSFFGYFLLSLVFFPLALIMAYMVQDRSMGVAPA